jgi:hypothetical protein
VKILARLCKVSGWIAIQKQFEMKDVPASGSLISVDGLTADELTTLGLSKDDLGSGRWFEVVNIRALDPLENPERSVELDCLHRSDADVAARRKREAVEIPVSASPDYERLTAFFRNFGRSA